MGTKRGCWGRIADANWLYNWQDGQTMRDLINWLYGVGNALFLFPEPRHYHIDRNGFSTDARKLRGDVDTVARGLRKQLKHEPANNRAR